jgi:rRNA maturation endonuclease Nob1
MPLLTKNQSSPSNAINESTLLALAFVLVAGAVGGLLYWITAKWTGTQLPVVFGAATVPILMLLGALAAAVGVYVLTASDMGAIRTYVFAILCGLAWQPMLSAGARLASNASASNQTAALGTQVEQVQTANQTGNQAAVAAAVQQTVPLINKSLELSSSVTDSAKRTEILDSSKQAITQLQASAAKAPEASAEALANVSVSAANSGQSTVALQAIESLDTVSKDPAIKQNPALRLKLAQSLSKVAVQSKDLSVQKAAKAAFLQIQ